MFLAKNRIKVALRISPSPLPNHLVEPAEDDVDVGGEEFAFVIEAVAHKVAVDGHPRERGRLVVGRGLGTFRGSGEHVGVTLFKKPPAQGGVAQHKRIQLVIGKAIHQPHPGVRAVDGERHAAVGLAVVVLPLRPVEHRRRFAATASQHVAVRVDELLPRGVGEGGLVADEAHSVRFHPGQQLFGHVRLFLKSEVEEAHQEVPFAERYLLPRLFGDSRHGGIKGGLGHPAACCGAYGQKLLACQFVKSVGNGVLRPFVVYFNLDPVHSLQFLVSISFQKGALVVNV